MGKSDVKTQKRECTVQIMDNTDVQMNSCSRRMGVPFP